MIAIYTNEKAAWRLTASSDAEPTTEDQVAGGGAMAESETTAPSLDVPTSDPSNGNQPKTAANSDAGSEPSSVSSEGNSSGPRTRIVVYARPPERWAEQSGGDTESEPKPERRSHFEHTRLEAADSYYRGTPDGAYQLANLFKLSFLQDGEEETPQRKQQIEFFRAQYLKIASDLARFDHLTRIESIANIAAIDQSSGTPKQREAGFEQPSESTGLAQDILGIPDGRFALFSSSDPVRKWNARKAVLRENPDLSRMAVAGFAAAGGDPRSQAAAVAAAAAMAALAKLWNRIKRSPRRGVTRPPDVRLPEETLPRSTDDETDRDLLQKNSDQYISRDDLPPVLRDVLDILAPEGKLIGEAHQTGVRNVEGGTPAAVEIFKRVSRDAAAYTPISPYEGTMVEFPGGGTIGLRLKSSSGDAAIDVNIPLLEKIRIPGLKSLRRLHFPE